MTHKKAKITIRGLDLSAKIVNGKLHFENQSIPDIRRVEYDIDEGLTNGVYTGKTRAAAWITIAPGNYRIELYSRADGKNTIIASGSTVQAEKAPGICRWWMEEGELPAGFVALDK